MAPIHSGLIRSILSNPQLIDNISGGVAVPAQPEIYVDYLSSAQDDSNLNTYTFSTQTVGPGGITKSLDRLIVIVAYSADASGTEGDTPNELTVGGSPAVLWSRHTGGNSANEAGIGIYTFADTGLVTADIVCQYDDPQVRAAIDVYNVGNVEHESPHFVTWDTGNPDASGTVSTNIVQVAPGERGIAAGLSNSAGNSITWTNAIERTDSNWAGGGGHFSSAEINDSGITDTGTVTATWAASELRALCSAVWRQVGATPAYQTFGDTGSSKIREIVYNGGTGTGANLNPYVWDEVATGRLAGAGEQKYVLWHVDVEEASASSDLFDTTDVQIGGVNAQTLVHAHTGQGDDTSFGAFFLHSGTDTGTTIDVSVTNPHGTTGTRAGIQSWSIYVDSGHVLTTHDAVGNDSGGAHFNLNMSIRSYTIMANAGSGTGTYSSRAIRLRNTFDMDSNDDMAAFDDGDDTGGSFRFYAGDTGDPKDNVGSPGGKRQLWYENGSSNSHCIAWNFY